MNIHDIYRPLLRHFRKKRMKRFYQALAITPQTKILDVGGNAFIWEIAAQNGLPAIEHITVLNLYEEDKARLPANVTWVIGNGCDLPFADDEFDIVFSNSVIEHLGDYESQVCFAKEISRVGKGYWVQTPDPRFFLEPHYLSPFVHWLPTGILRKVARHATTWGLLTHPTKQQIEERLKELRLIYPKEFRQMFPQAEIIYERWIGMPKSLVAKCAFDRPVSAA
jgi:ubiquinone/menaquinone biosynthesis C-methylase UbiE